MMKIKSCLIALMFFIIIVTILGIFFERNNLLFISDYEKQKYAEILEISEADSFLPIRKYSKNAYGVDEKYCEIDFLISIEDYDNNALDYNEENYKNLLDCKCKKKIDVNNYLCTVRYSNVFNKGKFIEVSEVKKEKNVLCYTLFFIDAILIFAFIFLIIIELKNK